MPSGERQAAKGGGHLERGHQKLRGHSWNMLALLGSEATRNIGFRDIFVAIIWRANAQHSVYTPCYL